MLSAVKRIGPRRGLALIYIMVLMVAMIAFTSFAVDWGHVQVTKTELRRATDAAARYGAAGLKNILNGTSAASANAIAAGADNTADGSTVVISPSDVQLMIWNNRTGTGTVTSDPTAANAVQVSAYRTAARGNAVQLTFARIVGRTTYDVAATSVAELTAGSSVTETVKATGNPFLAGMPYGSEASVGNPHNDPDYAGNSSNPRQSPLQANLPFSPGAAMTFDGVNGNAGNSSSSGNYSADGNTGDEETNYTGNDNNILGIKAPLNCLVGVFLNDDQPNITPVPTADTTKCPTDYSQPDARDMLTYQPKLKQIFFIGDGRTSTGEVQQFVPPSGATRLYLATWDGYEWSNNVGSFSVTAHLSGSVSMVH